MIRRLPLLIFTFSVSIGFTQTVEWQRQFSIGVSISMASGVLFYNESITYSAIGARKWGYVAQNPTNTALGIGLAKIKSNSGDTIFVRRIQGWTSGISNMKIHKSFEGNLVIASVSVGDTIYDSQILIQKVDTNGNSIWVLPITDGYDSPQISKLIPTNDGGTFVLGSAISTIGGFQDWFLIKVGFNGQLLWSQRYSSGQNAYCEANNIEPLRNGNYMISGMAEPKVWSVEVNGDGNYVDEHPFYETQLPYLNFGAVVRQTHYKSFVASGEIESPIKNYYFARFDSAYNKVWGGENVARVGKVIATSSDGKILTLEGKFIINDTIFLKVYNFDSTLVWSYPIPRSGISPQNATINDVAFDGLGNVVLCGTANKPASTRDELFFMKISGIGLAYDPLADTIWVSKKEKIRNQTIISAFPNPTTKEIRFRGLQGSFQIWLYSSEGKLVLCKKTVADMPLHIETLAPGLYSYRIKQGDLWYSGRVMKE